MNNVVATFIGFTLDLILLYIAIFTGAWTIDQARFLLSSLILLSSALGISGLIRWIKYGVYTKFKKSDEPEV